MDKRDARTLSPNQLDELRDRAIALWKKGYNRRKIAALLDVHYNSVGRWVAICQIEGAGALRSAKRGRKKGTLRNLTEKQEKMIQRLIIDKAPDQLEEVFPQHGFLDYQSRQGALDDLSWRFQRDCFYSIS